MADLQEKVQEKQESGLKKQVTRLEFYGCFLLLLAVLAFVSLLQLYCIKEAAYSARHEGNQIEKKISEEIGKISLRVGKEIEEGNHPLQESGTKMLDVNFQEKTALLQMSVVPKVYQEGMEVYFLLTCDGAEPLQVPALEGNGRKFTAEYTVPFCDKAALKVVLKRGNEEEICSIGNQYINSNVMPQVYAICDGSILFGTNVHRMERMVEFRFDVPEWMMQAEKFTLKNVQTIVQIDGKTVQTVPMEKAQEHSRGLLYTAEIPEFQLREGETLQVLCTAEDNYGLRYTYIVEEGTAAHNDYIETELKGWEDGKDHRLTVE